MTAEAAVMNRLGVALAADSAVTVTLGRAAKVYTSSDKLFQLSKTAPVGILIYGNADFVGMPWETVIKAFRREIGGKHFDAVEEYASRFLRFLSASRAMIPRKIEIQRTVDLVAVLYMHVRRDMEEALNVAAERKNGLSPKEVPAILDAVVAARFKDVLGRKLLQGLGDQPSRRIRARLSAAIPRVLDMVFGKLPLSKTARQLLVSLSVEVLTREYFGPLLSGAVIAGFGEREFMPSLCHFHVEEMVLGRPRAYISNESAITHENDASVLAFAQRDVVRTFMEGIDQKLESHIADTTQQAFVGVGNIVVDVIQKADPKLGRALAKALNKELPRLAKSLAEKWGDQKRTVYWLPVVQTVAALPKDELAAMAEALVNLTKLRRRVTPTRETVGGPVDVAVVTKGDGFVWVKRKHYFPPELNPRVLARYHKEG